jgi:hypothetical protein
MRPRTVSPDSSVSAHFVVVSRPSFPTRCWSRASSRSWNGSWTHSALPWCTCRWKESCRPSSAPSSSNYGPDEPSNTHMAATWAIVQSEAPYLDPSTNYWRRRLQNSLICIFCRSLQNYETCYKCTPLCDLNICRSFYFYFFKFCGFESLVIFLKNLVFFLIYIVKKFQFFCQMVKHCQKNKQITSVDTQNPTTKQF